MSLCRLCAAVWGLQRRGLRREFGFPALPGGFTAPLEDAGTAQGLAHVRSTRQQCCSPRDRQQLHREGREGKEGKERRACQLRAAEKVFHSSSLQPSKELQRLPIKTLLKHF